MTISHGGSKLFVSCRFFYQSEIGAIPGEHTVPSNWRSHLVFLGHHGCYTRILGVRDYSIERFHGIPSHYDLWVTFIQIYILHMIGKFSMFEYSRCSCSCSNNYCTGLFGSIILN